MANFKDFDSLVAGRPPFRWKVGEEVLEWPRKLPARVLLEARRRATKLQAEDANEEEAFDFLLDIGEKMSGPEIWGKLLDHEELDAIGVFVNNHLFPYYGLKDAEDEEGKAEETEEPLSPSSESSNTSEPSTQTSSDSTQTPDEDSTTTPSTGTPSSAVSDISPLVHSS